MELYIYGKLEVITGGFPGTELWKVRGNYRGLHWTSQAYHFSDISIIRPAW